MRKQLYYALAAVILGSAAAPAETQAATLAPRPTTAVVHAAKAERTDTLKKRKKRHKRRAAWKRKY
jgi:hypothetical protein